MAQMKSKRTVHLLKDVAEKADVDLREAQALVRSMVRLLETMPSGDKLRITGLGVFRKVTIEEHVGKNPKTRGAIQVPQRDKIRFMASNPLKDCR